jgi:anti-sigma B factor antagonist
VKPIEVSWYDTDIAIVTLYGEHDLSTRDELADELERHVRAGESLVVDLSHVEFIDSTVIHTLLRTYALSRDRGTSLTLQLGTAPIVGGVLDVTGVSTLLTGVATRQDAIHAARKNGSPAV